MFQTAILMFKCSSNVSIMYSLMFVFLKKKTSILDLICTLYVICNFPSTSKACPCDGCFYIYILYIRWHFIVHCRNLLQQYNSFLPLSRNDNAFGIDDILMISPSNCWLNPHWINKWRQVTVPSLFGVPLLLIIVYMCLYLDLQLVCVSAHSSFCLDLRWFWHFMPLCSLELEDAHLNPDG